MKLRGLDKLQANFNFRHISPISMWRGNKLICIHESNQYFMKMYTYMRIVFPKKNAVLLYNVFIDVLWNVLIVTHIMIWYMKDSSMPNAFMIMIFFLKIKMKSFHSNWMQRNCVPPIYYSLNRLQNGWQIMDLNLSLFAKGVESEMKWLMIFLHLCDYIGWKMNTFTSYA